MLGELHQMAISSRERERHIHRQRALGPSTSARSHLNLPLDGAATWQRRG